jgi:signal transduction histidine kinase
MATLRQPSSPSVVSFFQLSPVSWRFLNRELRSQESILAVEIIFQHTIGHDLAFDFRTESERLPIEVETALFRVLQESLTKVHRYSGSTEVNIRFRRKEDFSNGRWQEPSNASLV